jgi:thiol-disulfide isomerase/thioredoxin
MQFVKRAVLILAVALLCIFGISSAADRMVIGEMFTNTGCPPCYNADLALDDLAENYAAVFTAIRYHVWWPDPTDPYYNQNVSENRSRTTYYDVNAVPDFKVDGNINGGYQYGGWETLIDNESFVYSPLVISLSGTFDPSTLDGRINVSVYAEGDPALNNLRLRIGLIEDNIRWQAPNGIQVHDQTFRDMTPNAGGEGVTIAQGETVEFSYIFQVGSSFVLETCKLVAFVQSNANRHILQGARIAVPELIQTSVDDGDNMPISFALKQNYPNPFNAGTRIEFQTVGGNVNLEIFDITGALVTSLVNRNFEPGSHAVVWDGTDLNGDPVSSGVYFYRMRDSSGSDMKKMTLMK